MEELELVVTNPIYGLKIPIAKKKRPGTPTLRMTVSIKSKMNLLVTH